MILLVATTNPNKLREIRPLLEAPGTEEPCKLVTLADFAPVPEPEETGATFWENARIKALAYAAATGLTTVAEDSGSADQRAVAHEVPHQWQHHGMHRDLAVQLPVSEQVVHAVGGRALEPVRAGCDPQFVLQPHHVGMQRRGGVGVEGIEDDRVAVAVEVRLVRR